MMDKNIIFFTWLVAVTLVFIKHGNICISLVIFGPKSILQWPNYGKGFFQSPLERNKLILGKAAGTGGSSWSRAKAFSLIATGMNWAAKCGYRPVL